VYRTIGHPSAGRKGNELSKSPFPVGSETYPAFSRCVKVESNTEGKVIKRFAPNVPPEACEPDIVAALNRP
jgi:hypothetical protein